MKLARLVLFALLLFPGRARGAVPAVVTPEGRQTTSSLVENPPMGRLNYEANALGPVTLRENFSVDSTRVCYSNGASIIRVHVYLQGLVDSLVGADINDSAKVVWVGVRPKVHIVALPDSGSTSTLLTVGRQRVNGGPALVADTTGMRWTEPGAAQATWNRDVWARALPGEFLVPIQRPTTTGANGNWQPAWRSVDLCVPELECFTSPIFTAVVRIFGHSTAWPAPSSTWVVTKDPRSKYSVRLDFECIR